MHTIVKLNKTLSGRQYDINNGLKALFNSFLRSASLVPRIILSMTGQISISSSVDIYRKFYP